MRKTAAERRIIEFAEPYAPRWQLFNHRTKLFSTFRMVNEEPTATVFGYFGPGGKALSVETAFENEDSNDMVYIYGHIPISVVTPGAIGPFLEVLVLLLEREVHDELERKKLGVPTRNKLFKTIETVNQ